MLYASSQRVGAFVETLARFRPDLAVLAELDEIEGDPEPKPALPYAWLRNRMIGEATLSGRFVDVGDARSLAKLREALAASAIKYGLDEIDGAAIRLRAPRSFTQQVSRFVYERRDDQGLFSGIRYGSRLGDPFVNWAVFEPTPDTPDPISAATSASVDAEDRDFLAALEILGLLLA